MRLVEINDCINAKTLNTMTETKNPLEPVIAPIATIANPMNLLLILFEYKKIIAPNNMKILYRIFGPKKNDAL